MLSSDTSATQLAQRFTIHRSFQEIHAKVSFASKSFMRDSVPQTLENNRHQTIKNTEQAIHLQASALSMFFKPDFVSDDLLVSTQNTTKRLAQFHLFCVNR